VQIAILFNPSSGRYSDEKVGHLADGLKAVGHQVSRHECISFWRAADAPEADILCVSGGDGTARQVLETHQQDPIMVPLYIHPAGTINLVARERGYRSEADDLISRLAGREHINAYLGQINSHPFLTCASIGPDSYAVACVSPTLKNRVGRLAYGVALINLLWAWPRRQMKVQIDGAQLCAEMILVLKARHYAGSWVPDSSAAMTADHFRVIMLPRARRRDYFRFLVYLVSGRRFACSTWHFMCAKQISVMAEQPLPVQADGDIVSHLPAQISIHSKTVSFL
jgi:diacylglycerol kinase (ATP)